MLVVEFIGGGQVDAADFHQRIDVFPMLQLHEFDVHQ